MKTFQFPVTQKRSGKPTTKTVLPREIKAPEVVGLIQGQVPMSREEWRTAVALWQLKVSFDYQVGVHGGYIRGGYLLDFLVFTPFPVPMPLMDSYWHPQGDTADQLMLATLGQVYHVKPVILYSEELESVDMAVQTIRSKLKL